MLKVLLFLFFLVAFGFWSWASLKSFKKTQDDLLAGKSFWSGQLLSLLSLGGFFVFMYLLSGFWNLKLILLFFAASQIGTLTAWMLGAVLGSHSEKLGLRALWAGKEIDIKHAAAMNTMGALTGVLALSYPVVAGVLFFRHQWASPVLQVLMVKCWLLLLAFSGYASVMIVVVMLLASENLDEDTRQHIFINQLSGMIPTALFVALALWAFGVGGKVLAFDFARISRTLSLQTLLLLLLFFTGTILVPYLVGTQRAHRANLGLQEERRRYVAELAGILEAPTGSLYITKLTGLRDEITRTQDKLTNDDVLLTLAKQVKQNPDQIQPAAKPLVDALEKTRDLDPRFKFLDYLGRFEKELEEIIADLQKRTEGTIEQAAEHWSKKYEIRKAELVKEIETARSRKPLVTVGIGALATTIVSGILSEVGKTAWQLITHTPK